MVYGDFWQAFALLEPSLWHVAVDDGLISCHVLDLKLIGNWQHGELNMENSRKQIRRVCILKVQAAVKR